MINNPEMTWEIIKKTVQKAELTCEETGTQRRPKDVFLGMLGAISGAVILLGTNRGSILDLYFLTLHG